MQQSLRTPWPVWILKLAALAGGVALCQTAGEAKARGRNPFEGTVSPASGLRHPGILQSPAMLAALNASLDAGDPERLKLWQLTTAASLDTE